MAENGELVLLRPTLTAPNELARFRVFAGKTWNPLALAGEFLLVRNDQEAACLRLSRADAVLISEAGSSKRVDTRQNVTEGGSH